MTELAVRALLVVLGIAATIVAVWASFKWGKIRGAEEQREIAARLDMMGLGRASAFESGPPRRWRYRVFAGNNDCIFETTVEAYSETIALGLARSETAGKIVGRGRESLTPLDTTVGFRNG